MVLASSTRWSSPGERAATSIAIARLPAPAGAHDGDEAVVKHQCAQLCDGRFAPDQIDAVAASQPLPGGIALGIEATDVDQVQVDRLGEIRYRERAEWFEPEVHGSDGEALSGDASDQHLTGTGQFGDAGRLVDGGADIVIPDALHRADVHPHPRGQPCDPRPLLGSQRLVHSHRCRHR